MKKTIHLITIILSVIFVKAQNDMMYLVKNGASVAEYNIATGVDSIVFYDPRPINNPVVDVPFFSATLTKGNGPSNSYNNTPAQWHLTPGVNGAPAKYYYTSQVANTTVGLYVLFPPSYETATTKRYPVIYHLHGLGQSQTEQESSFMGTAYSAMQNGTPEFIYISVGGPQNCWWSDGVDGVKAESHIINEILSLVDQNFRTLAKRESRAIEGFSMGGFGATKIGLKYPQYFKAVGGFCPVTYSYPGGGFDNQLMTGVMGFGSEYNRVWGGDAEKFKLDCARYHFATNKTNLIANNMAVLLRPGLGDGYKALADGFKTELDGTGIIFNFSYYGGGHDMASYNKESFDFFLNNLDKQ